MVEQGESTRKNPIEVLAGLIKEARQAQLYIERQDIYPEESQRAARILPAIAEDIDRRKAELTGPEIVTAEKMADLMGKLEPEEAEVVRPPVAGQLPSRQELLKELDKIATNDQSDKEE